MENGNAKVTYDIAIVGKNFENDVKHEEKSSVSEEVVVQAGGKIKISKTLEGRFWYVQ